MSGRRATLAAGALVVLTASAARAGGGDPVGRVVFARGDALWLTDGRGKGPAVELAKLPAPASHVRVLRTDAVGAKILVDLDGAWSWAPVPTDGSLATLTPLPCAAGPARLSAAGDCVICGGADGKALLIRLDDGKQFRRDLPATTALVERDGARSLVWPGDGAVHAAPITDRKQAKVVAPTAPVRGLLVAPDGARAVGVYRAPAAGMPRQTDPRDQLMTFALDGVAATRRLIRDGVALDWSWDSRWLLVQDGGKACLVRAVGGEYKCWKGFTAVGIAPDGAWALLLGPRDGVAGVDTAPTAPQSEGADSGEGEVEDEIVALPTGPLSLYRGKLAGAFTERPALLEKLVDGPAVWLPPVAP